MAEARCGETQAPGSAPRGAQEKSASRRGLETNVIAERVDFDDEEGCGGGEPGKKVRDCSGQVVGATRESGDGGGTFFRNRNQNFV